MFQKHKTITAVFVLILLFISSHEVLSFEPQWNKNLPLCEGSPKIAYDLSEESFWNNCHGTIIFPNNGMAMEGDFTDNILSGYLKLTMGDDDIVILGDMKLGQGIGYVDSKIKENVMFPESAEYSGHVKNFMFNGFGKLTIDGVVTYYGNFVNSLMDGYGLMFYPDGSVFSTAFSEGEIISSIPLTYESSSEQSSFLDMAIDSFIDDTKSTFNISFGDWSENLSMYHMMSKSMCDDYSYPSNLSMCTQVADTIYNYVLPIYDDANSVSSTNYPETIVVEWRHLIDNPFSADLEDTFNDFQKRVRIKAAVDGIDLKYTTYTDRFFYIHRYEMNK